jgi:hypothetical protein
MLGVIGPIQGHFPRKKTHFFYLQEVCAHARAEVGPTLDLSA